MYLTFCIVVNGKTFQNYAMTITFIGQCSLSNSSKEFPYPIIDRASLAEKSVRKDEKMLFWPPPILLVWLPNPRETKQRRNN